MHENRVYYELPDANAQIPRLEHLFAELARIQRRVNNLSVHASKMGVQIDPDDIDSTPSSSNPIKRAMIEKMKVLSMEYAEKLDEIAGLGVIVDDLNLGMVNFYSLINGEEVFLSWQYGEPEVKHWHSVTENSEARRPLRELIRRNSINVVLH